MDAHWPAGLEYIVVYTKKPCLKQGGGQGPLVKVLTYMKSFTHTYTSYTSPAIITQLDNIESGKHEWF